MEKKLITKLLIIYINICHEQATKMATVATEQELNTKLKELGVDCKVLEHKTITTMAQGKEIMSKLEGVVPINLLLKDKKGSLYLLIKTLENKTPFRKIGRVVKVKGLQMVSKEQFSAILKVPHGSATVFALLNDKEHTIKVIVDKTIPSDGLINFHPLRNDATMTISYEGMERFINDLGNEILYF